MTNSADPNQLASPTDLDLHCLQRQGISGFSRTRVKQANLIHCKKISVVPFQVSQYVKLSFF